MITETEALRIAETALADIQGAGPPYGSEMNEGSWLVTTASIAGLTFAVRIDGNTGEATVEAYQSVTIDEEL